MDAARFAAKVTAFLREHDDHIAIQRRRRNRQLTEGDLTSLEEVLVASGTARVDLQHAAGQAQGLGLFVRSLVGLDRAAATEAFGDFLVDTSFSVNQIRFVELIVDELTTNGVVEPERLFESPYTDRAPTGPQSLFGESDLGTIRGTLVEVKDRAVPSGAA